MQEQMKDWVRLDSFAEAVLRCFEVSLKIQILPLVDFSGDVVLRLQE